MNKIIKEIINKKIEKKEMFTSLDITNELKKQGIWIKNSVVSKKLKEIFKNKKKKYMTTLISVSLKGESDENNALLYHHKKDNIKKYKNKEGKIITKEEFIDITKILIKRSINSLANINKEV